MSETIDDSSDLKLFAEQHDEAALSRLIRRHSDFVYSACLRQVRDPGLAEDAAQAVFILLAKKAGIIRDDAALIGWLFNVARYASRNALRGERRRRKYEKEAALPSNAVIDPPAASSEIDPRLDDALARLSGADRQAILLRFFQDQNHDQIARSMNTNAHAAKMRVYRALEKLRNYLQHGNDDLTPGVVEAGLLAAAKTAAPVGFADSATRGSLGAQASTSAVAIAGAVTLLMLLRKIAMITSAAVGILLIVGGISLVLRQTSSTTKVSAVASTRPSNPNWRKAFDAVYTLADGEDLRRVQQPYIGARSDFQLEKYHPRAYNGRGDGPIGSRSVGNTTDPPDAMDLEWDPDTRRVEHITRINWGAWAFESLTVNLIGLRPDQFTMPAKMTGISLAGDWVFRKGSTPQERLQSFQKQLAKTPAAFVFEKKMLDRQVIVIRGQFTAGDWPYGLISLRWNSADTKPLSQGGDVGFFIRHMTMALGRPLINEWIGSEKVYFEFPTTKDFKVKTLTGEAQEAKLREILAMMATQMHVELVPETRQIETFVIEPAKPPATKEGN